MHPKKSYTDTRPSERSCFLPQSSPMPRDTETFARSESKHIGLAVYRGSEPQKNRCINDPRFCEVEAESVLGNTRWEDRKIPGWWGELPGSAHSCFLRQRVAHQR